MSNQDLLGEAKRLTEDSSLTPELKDAAFRLLDHFGLDWWVQLAESPDPLGPGVTSPITLSILEVEVGEDTGALWTLDGLELYDDFIFNSEDFGEDEPGELADGAGDDIAAHGRDSSPIKEFLAEWGDARISYRRTVLKEKTPQARAATYAEIDALDFGGLEGACRTCGAVFFDNFGVKIREEAYYCSLACIGRAEFDCLECGEHYAVGTGSNRENRRRRLSGWCSHLCENPWAGAEEESAGWVRSMVRRARDLNRDYDSDITRRKVFEKAKGICHYCGAETVWKTPAFSDELATVDHVIPWEKGGSHTWGNVVLACWLCNAMKGTRLEFVSRGDRKTWRKSIDEPGRA
jgi:5-methylcytosine-specific restriction endonuclease McrA